jgi:hypothetical protein
LRDAAATDTEAAVLAAELDDNRLARMTHNAKALMRTGRLRPALTEHDVRDVLWLYSAPEVYELLVRRRHWTHQQLARFVTDAMADALLPDATRRSSARRPTPTTEPPAARPRPR